MSEDAEPEVRDGVVADLPAALAVYGREAEQGTATFETTTPGAEAWRPKVEGPYPFLVAEVDGAFAGFAYAGEYRPRAAYHLTAETSIYLDPAHTGRGVGRTLYAALLERLRRSGFHTALAMVALPNDASLALHDRLGFAEVGRLREVGDKFGRMIDVAVLQLML